MLGAAAGLLAAHGMRRWTMDDVAEAAGLSRATVYRRFPGRDELVKAALAAQARAFFAAVSAAVDDVSDMRAKLVAGFEVGVRLARGSVLPGLLRHDPAAALSLLGSGSLLAAGRAALVERYETLAGTALSGPERDRAEAAAEVLVRLGLSFVLMPDPPPDERLAGLIAAVVG